MNTEIAVFDNDLENRVAKDPLAQILRKLTQAMKADYGWKYDNQFKNPDELKTYKRRLYEKMEKFSSDDIIDGYELYFDENPLDVPTIPQIVEFARMAKKRREAAKKADDDAKRVLAVQPHTIECNPLKMLSDAKKQTDVEKPDLTELLRRHDVILNMNYNNIRHGNVGPEHECAVSFCHKAGSISSNSRGGGPFYCIEHYRNES